MNRLTSVTQSSQVGGHAVAPKLAEFSYNLASQRTDLMRYSAISASPADLELHSRWNYDEAGRLTNITHSTDTIASGEHWDGTSTLPSSLSSGELLAGYTFQHDQNNRLTDFSTYADGTETAYGYDVRDQLTSAATTAISGLSQPFGLSAAESYDFDATGNRKSTGGASQSTPGTHNRLQTDGTFNYTYDDEGNTLTRTSISTGEVTEYDWDYRNRLILVTDRVSSGGSITQKVAYEYDVFGQRVAKRLDNDGDGDWDRDEAFVWADGQTVLRLEDSDGEAASEGFRILSRYLYGTMVDEVLADEQYSSGTGVEVDAATATGTAGETLWTLSDHLGSVRDVVDNSGVVRQHVAYDSFGNRIVEQDYDSSGTAISSGHAAAIDTLFGYTGRDWDQDTELQNNRARWYDPSTGRWLSNDPIGFAADDSNLYRYVGNGPTTKVDPSGLAAAEGHHWVPIDVIVRLRVERILTRSEARYFAGRRSGGLVAPHCFWTEYNGVRHDKYSEEVEEQLRDWKTDKLGKHYRAKDVANNIRDGRNWNGGRNDTIKRFNDGVKADMKKLDPYKNGTPRKNLMDGEGKTDLQVRRNGDASLRRRGKSLAMLGAMAGLASNVDSAAHAHELPVSFRDSPALKRAMRAAHRGDMAGAERCMIGVGHPIPSLYEELLAVDPKFALPFFDVLEAEFKDIRDRSNALPINEIVE